MQAVYVVCHKKYWKTYDWLIMRYMVQYLDVYCVSLHVKISVNEDFLIISFFQCPKKYDHPWVSLLDYYLLVYTMKHAVPGCGSFKGLLNNTDNKTTGYILTTRLFYQNVSDIT